MAQSDLPPPSGDGSRPFSATPSQFGDVPALILVGELDEFTAPLFEASLNPMLDHSRTELVIDLSQLHFLDSTGLGILLRAHHVLSERGARFVLVAPRPQAVRVFEATGLSEFFNIEYARSSD
jgi:anti-anti-sigma factor